MIETTNTTSTTPRRYFRFRLRTLLVMVAVLTVPLGWVGWELDHRRREHSAIAWVEKMGGTVYFAFNLDERSWWEKTKDNLFGEWVCVANLDDTQVSDLSSLAELKKLEWLGINNTQVSDLSPLSELKNLRWLDLNGTQVGDLSPLAELKNLRWLSLNDTPVSDLSPLAELKYLHWLYLDATPVSDLSPLTELKNLSSLHLNATQVSDLSPLAELKYLESLDLCGTGVSDEQVEELRLALPNCTIDF